MDPTHTRKEGWDGVPFASMEEVGDLIQEFTDLVLAAAEQSVDSSVVGVRYPDRQYGRMPLTDFRELAAALSFDEAILHVVVQSSGAPKAVAIEFHIWSTSEIRLSVDLEVSGTNEVAVNGVFVAAKERVGKLYEHKRHAEELAAAAETEAAPSEPESRWHRVVYNPYTVAIVAAVVAGAILFGLGYLLGSN